MDKAGMRRKSLGMEEKRARRESFGKDFEKKLQINPEISIQKFKEEIALYQIQIESWFAEEMGLSGAGLNPKVAAEVAFITDTDVEDLFGKCSKLRTTNTFLNPDARKDLMELYNKIFGSKTVTNNEFASWLVKGYIATLKNINVNWALAASTTAAEKADRAHRALLRLLNPDCNDDVAGSGSKHNTCSSQQGGSSGRNVIDGAEVRAKSTPSGLGFRILCPYEVSQSDLRAVKGVSEIESELLVIASSKVRYVEANYKKISERLIGIKFTMDDRRVTAKEDEEKVGQLKSELQSALKAILELELQATGMYVGSAEHEDLAKKLGILWEDRDSVQRKVDVHQAVAESNRDRAMKGEDFYQDIEEEQMRAESDLEVLKREIVEISRLVVAVEDQRLEMEKGGGLSLWPKPALHPAMAGDLPASTMTLQLHPCVFCNRGYPYFDVVIASCKHIYHIFCAAALAKLDNRCTRCAEVFNPQWWQSFGFQGAYSGFEEEKERLDLPTKEEKVRQSLKENGSRHVMNWTQSSLKHSNWSSTNSIERSCDPIWGGRSTTTAGVQMLASRASMTASKEPNTTDARLPILNTRGQEEHSPVKNQGVSHRAIGTGSVVVAPEEDQCENLEISCESQLPGTPKLRHSLLKTAADLPFDDGDRRKLVALNSLEDIANNIHVNIESSSQEMVGCRSLNLDIEEDKPKAKKGKRKAREQPPSVGRISTRAETKKR